MRYCEEDVLASRDSEECNLSRRVEMMSSVFITTTIYGQMYQEPVKWCRLSEKCWCNTLSGRM